MARHKNQKSLERYRAEHRARPPRPREAPVDQSTGLFQPSENPRLGAEAGPKALKLKRDLTKIEDAISMEERMGEVHEGQAYEETQRKPGDRFFGPDIGQRPHRPKGIASRRK
jgi:hypothetical protein